MNRKPTKTETFLIAAVCAVIVYAAVGLLALVVHR